MAKVKQDEYNITKDPQQRQFNKVGKRNRNNETEYTGAKDPPIKPDQFPINKIKAK